MHLLFTALDVTKGSRIIVAFGEEPKENIVNRKLAQFSGRVAEHSK
jgi:hypothetical protein